MSTDIYVVASPNAAVFHWFRDCPALEAATHEVVVESMDGIAPRAVTESHGLLPLCRRCEDALARTEPRERWAERLPTRAQGSTGAALREWWREGQRLALFADRVELTMPPLLWGDGTVHVIPYGAVVELAVARRVPLVQAPRLEITYAADEETEVTVSFEFERGDDPDEAHAAIDDMIAQLAPSPDELRQEVKRQRRAAAEQLVAARGAPPAPKRGTPRIMRAGGAEADEPVTWTLDVPSWSGALALHHDLSAPPGSGGERWTVALSAELAFTLSRADEVNEYAASWRGPARASVNGRTAFDGDILDGVWEVDATVLGTAALEVYASQGRYLLSFDFPDVPEHVTFTFRDGSSENEEASAPHLGYAGGVDALPRRFGRLERDHAEVLSVPLLGDAYTVHQRWSIVPAGGGGGKGDDDAGFFDPKSPKYRPEYDFRNPAYSFRAGGQPHDADQWGRYGSNWIKNQVRQKNFPALKNTFLHFRDNWDLQAEFPQVAGFVREARKELFRLGELPDE